MMALLLNSYTNFKVLIKCNQNKQSWSEFNLNQLESIIFLLLSVAESQEGLMG